jgi:hypothetical protein
MEYPWITHEDSPWKVLIVSPVGLGTAATFSVLAGQTVTNTGPSVVSADLGVSPGSSVTGFPPGVVLGTVHAADATLARNGAVTLDTDTITAMICEPVPMMQLPGVAAGLAVIGSPCCAAAGGAG